MKEMSHKEYILSEIEDFADKLSGAGLNLKHAGLQLRDIVRHVKEEMGVKDDE